MVLVIGPRALSDIKDVMAILKVTALPPTQNKFWGPPPKNTLPYRVRYWRGRVPYFNQSEARKQCFTASDWLNYGTLPHKYRTLLKPLSD